MLVALLSLTLILTLMVVYVWVTPLVDRIEAKIAENMTVEETRDFIRNLIRDSGTVPFEKLASP